MRGTGGTGAPATTCRRDRASRACLACLEPVPGSTLAGGHGGGWGLGCAGWGAGSGAGTKAGTSCRPSSSPAGRPPAGSQPADRSARAGTGARTRPRPAILTSQLLSTGAVAGTQPSLIRERPARRDLALGSQAGSGPLPQHGGAAPVKPLGPGEGGPAEEDRESAGQARKNSTGRRPQG